MSYPGKLVWRRTLLAVFCCLAAGCGDPPTSPVPQTQQDLLRQKLRQKVSLDENELPLDQLLAQLGKECGVNFEIDRPALQIAGIAPQNALLCSLRCQDVSLDTALRLVLQELGLKHALVDDVIHVTSVEAAAKLVVAKVYPVAHLLENHPEFDEQYLAIIFGELIDPDNEGVNRCLAKPGVLIVTQPELEHDQTARLLREMVSAAHPSLHPPASRLPPEEAAIDRALNQPVTMNFEQVLLAQVADDLAKQHKISITLFRPALEDAGVVLEHTRITRKVEGVRLRSALKLILDEFGLECQQRRDTLLITSHEDAVSYLESRIHPVSDLLNPRRGINYRALLDMILNNLHPGSWSKRGGSGTVAAVPGGLLIHASPYEHEFIQDNLTQLRRALDPSVVDYNPLDASDLVLLDRKLAETTQTAFSVPFSAPFSFFNEDPHFTESHTRYYRIGQFQPPPLGLPSDKLWELIQEHVLPTNVAYEPFHSYQHKFADVLIVTHSTALHALIQRNLSALERILNPTNARDVAFNDSPSLRRMEVMLGKPTQKWESQKRSLTDVVNKLQQRHRGLNIEFDRQALGKAGIVPEGFTVKFRIENACVSDVLDKLCGSDLGWKISAEAVVISTLQDSWDSLIKFHYFDRRQLGSDNRPSVLLDLLVKNQGPGCHDYPSPRDGRWHCSVTALPKGIVVKDGASMQRRINRLLDALRRQLAGEAAAPSPQERLLDKLAAPARLKCKDITLESLLERLETEYRIDIGNLEPGSAPGRKFLRKASYDIRVASLAELLDEVVKPHQLRWSVLHGQIEVFDPTTTPSAAFLNIASVYDAGPLLSALKLLRLQADHRELATQLISLHTVDPPDDLDEKEYNVTLLRNALVVFQPPRGHIAVRRVLGDVEAVRGFAEKTASAKGAQQAALVLGGLKHSNPTVRAVAALVLRRFDVDSQPAVRALAAALNDSNTPLRLCAMQSLKYVSHDSPLVKSIVLPSFKAPLCGSQVMRRHAAAALCKLGAASTTLLAEALTVENDEGMVKNDEGNYAIFAALDALGPDAEAAIPTLLKLIEKYEQLSSSDGRWRSFEVCCTLGKIGKPAIPALIELARRHGCRVNAFNALAEAGAASVEVFTLLEDAIRRDTDVWVQRAAHQALQRLVPERAEKLKEP